MLGARRSRTSAFGGISGAHDKGRAFGKQNLFLHLRAQVQIQTGMRLEPYDLKPFGLNGKFRPEDHVSRETIDGFIPGDALPLLSF